MTRKLGLHQGGLKTSQWAVFLANLLFISADPRGLAEASTSSGLQPDGACSLLSLFPFTDRHVYTYRGPGRRPPPSSPYGNFTRFSAKTIGFKGYTYSAAALMAMEHFNSRDSSVVPEIASLNPNCTVYFPTDSKSYRLRDSGINNLVSADAILETVNEPGAGEEEGVNGTIPVCAVVGPYGSHPAAWTAPMTSSLNLPQLFFSSITSSLTEPDFIDNTARLSPTDEEYASRILSYLSQHDREHLAIVHGGSDHDQKFAEDMTKLGPSYGVNVVLFGLTRPPAGTNGKQWSEHIFRQVKDSGIRTIMRLWVSIGPQEIPKLANRAATAGLLDDDYLWVFEHNMAPPDELADIVGAQEAESNLDRLLRGALIFSPLDGFVWRREKDPFLISWRKLGTDFVDKINALSPLSSEQPEFFRGNADFFETNLPSTLASYVYDSIMAIGFGACKAQEGPSEARGEETGTNGMKPPKPREGSEGESSTPPFRHGKPKKPVSRNPLAQAIGEATFTGASGSVSFGQIGDDFRSRVGSGVTFGAYNVRGLPVNATDEKRRYSVVLTSTSRGIEWQPYEDRLFLFKSGLNKNPGESQVILEKNLGLLPRWARALGFSLLLFSWLLSVFLSCMVWRWKEKPSIQAGQPFFLQILLIGSILTTGAILSLSFDEGFRSMDEAALSAACTMTPWLFFLGMTTMYSGLFCKLWRLSMVTQQFRRRQVKPLHAVWPLVFLLVTTVSLLGIWTAMDPWTWQRDFYRDVIPPYSYGRCQSENFPAFFAPLCGVMVIATLLAVLMAWKTKDRKVGHDLLDSSTVFYAVSSQLQAWFVGLPILAVLSDSSAVATYLGRILLIFVFSSSAVLIVVVPRVWRAWSLTENTDSRSSRVHVSGILPPRENSSGANNKSSLSQDETTRDNTSDVRNISSKSMNLDSRDAGHAALSSEDDTGEAGHEA